MEAPAFRAQARLTRFVPLPRLTPACDAHLALVRVRHDSTAWGQCLPAHGTSDRAEYRGQRGNKPGFLGVTGGPSPRIFAGMAKTALSDQAASMRIGCAPSHSVILPSF